MKNIAAVHINWASTIRSFKVGLLVKTIELDQRSGAVHVHCSNGNHFVFYSRYIIGVEIHEQR